MQIDVAKNMFLCILEHNQATYLLSLFARLLSITVRGIHVWNGLASNMTQLPSLQQFKKSLKSTLLSSYL